MSKKHSSIKSKTLSVISIIIVCFMFAFAFFFIYISEDKDLAASDIWQHIKTISLIVVGYWFGSARDG